MKLSRYDATKFIDGVASLRRCVSQFCPDMIDFDDTLVVHNRGLKYSIRWAKRRFCNPIIRFFSS